VLSGGSVLPSVAVKRQEQSADLVKKPGAGFLTRNRPLQTFSRAEARLPTPMQSPMT